MQKLLRQLAEDSISDIEDTDGDGQNIGLQNLSLEVFRQDLIDYFEQYKGLFRTMPCGAFSGFCNVPTLFTDMPESLVAVLGYPHREHKKDSYKHVYLMCQPANGEIIQTNANNALPTSKLTSVMHLTTPTICASYT